MLVRKLALLASHILAILCLRNVCGAQDQATDTQPATVVWSTRFQDGQSTRDAFKKLTGWSTLGCSETTVVGKAKVSVDCLSDGLITVKQKGTSKLKPD